MALLRESLVNSAPSDASSNLVKPADPLRKAISVIAETPGLDDGEKDQIARSFEGKFGDARIPDFLQALADKVVGDATRAARNAVVPQQATTPETPALPTGPKAETTPLPRGGVLWRRPRHRGH